MNKKQLYETIIRNVSKEVKKALNEMAIIGKKHIDYKANDMRHNNYKHNVIDQLLTTIRCQKIEDNIFDIAETFLYIKQSDVYMPDYIRKHISTKFFSNTLSIYTRNEDNEIIMVNIPIQNGEIISNYKIFTTYPLEVINKNAHWIIYDEEPKYVGFEELEEKDFEGMDIADILYLKDQINDLFLVIKKCEHTLIENNK